MQNNPAASRVDVDRLARELRVLRLSARSSLTVPAGRCTRRTPASTRSFPLGVVTPRTRNDVVEVVRVSRENGVSITARGGGTSQAGQAIGAGISLDFSRYMNRVLDLDTAAATVTVEPGIVLDELNDAAQAPRTAPSPGPFNLKPGHDRRDDRQQLGRYAFNHLREDDRLRRIGRRYLRRRQQRQVWGRYRRTRSRAKLAQQDLEGAAYKTVQRLGSELASEIRARYPRILRRVGGYNLDEFIPDEEDDGGPPRTVQSGANAGRL